jgi:membrane-associated phospholipid phosphatase
MNSGSGLLCSALKSEWKTKLFLGTAACVAFWAGYSILEHVLARPAVRMPELGFDRLLPFCPGAAFIYLSQFFTMPLVIWLMRSRRQLRTCCRRLALLVGVAFVVYFFWPTTVARPASSLGQWFLYDLIVKTDLPRNACPSLHAAFGVFTAVSAWEVFREWRTGRWFIVAVCVLTAAVLASTLLIKQHVVLDLLAGIMLGIMSVGITWWWERANGERASGRVEISVSPGLQIAGHIEDSSRTAENPPGGTP